VDGPNSKLSLYRGYERRSLEQSTSEGLKGSGKSGRVGKAGMQSKDADVFLALERTINTLLNAVKTE
jgi:hypothetical protein